MKRKMEKMSEVSRVKTYKKGSKWVSSLMVTAGVGALALSAGSLSANADTVAANKPRIKQFRKPRCFSCNNFSS